MIATALNATPLPDTAVQNVGEAYSATRNPTPPQQNSETTQPFRRRRRN